MGANEWVHDVDERMEVSIHAPVMGANSHKHTKGDRREFQSTHP